jgi:hypothetical protein
MFRYFYNSQGAIVGQVFFNRTCVCTCLVGETTYVDSSVRIQMDQYHVVAGELLAI